MRPTTLDAVLGRTSEEADFIVIEGVMGLFDGARGGGGSTAEIARHTGWPVIMVVNAQGMGASVAALIDGFARFDPAVELAGIIFNRIGSDDHLEVLREAVRPLGTPVFGGLVRDTGMVLPSRHLGLVQAGEHPDLEAFLSRAAAVIGERLEKDELLNAFGPGQVGAATRGTPVPPLGQRIAVARDNAFRFAYPHVLEAWCASGAEVNFFSPLAGEGPGEDADAVYLPGGYPELHAGALAQNDNFIVKLQVAAARSAVIYGECGGYMVLGQGLVDKCGEHHAMAGLLPVATSFERRRRTLGYRQVTLIGRSPLGDSGKRYRGHEFHYAFVLGDEAGDPLFESRDARGELMPSRGSRQGSVMGSFIHLVDRTG